MAINLTMPLATELKPRILVFGVGGAGGNAVNNMITAQLVLSQVRILPGPPFRLRFPKPPET